MVFLDCERQLSFDFMVEETEEVISLDIVFKDNGSDAHILLDIAG